MSRYFRQIERLGREADAFGRSPAPRWTTEEIEAANRRRDVARTALAQERADRGEAAPYIDLTTLDAWLLAHPEVP